MAAFDLATLDRWRTLAIVDRDGTTVGTVSEFYLDRETGYPTWALVNTGLFGATRTFVPLVHATEISDGLQVPYEKSHIKDAPRVDLHDELTPDEEATLFAHYGVDYRPSTEPAPPEPGVTDPPDVPGAEWRGEDQADAPPGGSGLGEAGPPESGRRDQAEGDPDLSRPAPIERGLPGSHPAGSTPTTASSGAVDTWSRADEPGSPSPDVEVEVDRQPSASEELDTDDPTLAAAGPGPVPATEEATRTAGAPPSPPGEPSITDQADHPPTVSEDDRSPLERAKRRLERLVSGSQPPNDPADQDATERARREHLDPDDDPRHP
jgi:PRC-barrel domain protein